MKNVQNYELATTISRVTLGSVMLAHSVYLKLIVFTLPGTAKFFASLGLPEILSYLVFGIEALCGIALIIGFRVQLASMLLIPVLIGATWAHWSAGWLFTNQGGGWEYPLVLCFMAVVQVFLGNGKYSISQKAA